MWNPLDMMLGDTIHFVLGFTILLLAAIGLAAIVAMIYGAMHN